MSIKDRHTQTHNDSDFILGINFTIISRINKTNEFSQPQIMNGLLHFYTLLLSAAYNRRYCIEVVDKRALVLPTQECTVLPKLGYRIVERTALV